MVNGKTRPFVLLGSPVEHSVSPAMQTAAFRALGINAAYLPLRCSADDVAPIIRIVSQAGGGGNITLPHKQVAALAVTTASPLVQATGACNTFWAGGENSGSLGENTDVAGVLAALDRLGAPPTRWLVIGTGGSARAVVAAARTRGASVAITSRTDERRAVFESWARTLDIVLTEPAQCEVAINATPLGLNPGDPLPAVPASLNGIRFALDLVYAVEGTRWSRAMAGKGAVASDGREALVAQGAAAFRCWFPEHDPPIEVMRAVVNARLR
jgi:shikimate dehydrogenase